MKWERESHTVAVNTRKVVNKKSMAFKAIFRKRREENVNATSHLILIQGNTICGINRAQNGERNLYSWPFIQSNSACQLELHQITETQVMATCPETQFFFFRFSFWVEIDVLKCDLIKSSDPHAPMTGCLLN